MGIFIFVPGARLMYAVEQFALSVKAF